MNERFKLQYLPRKNEFKKIIPITFNNPLNVCFSNKKYLITIQTPQDLIVISKVSKT